MRELEFYIIITLIIIWIALNIVATIVVLSTHFEEKNRRTMQIVFVWLLPIIGALFAIFINKEDYFENRRLKKVGNNSESFDRGDIDW